MNLNELKKQIEKEIHIDENNLLEYSINYPKLQFKYLNYLTKEIFKLKKLELNKNKKYKEIYEKILLKSDVVLSKNQIEKIILSDPEFENIYIKYIEQEEKVNYLKNVVEMFKSNSYLINNIIKLYIFLNGG